MQFYDAPKLSPQKTQPVIASEAGQIFYRVVDFYRHPVDVCGSLACEPVLFHHSLNRSVVRRGNSRVGLSAERRTFSCGVFSWVKHLMAWMCCRGYKWGCRMQNNNIRRRKPDMSAHQKQMRFFTRVALCLGFAFIFMVFWLVNRPISGLR